MALLSHQMHLFCQIIRIRRSSPEPLEWEHWLQDPRQPENSLFDREYQIVRTHTNETTWIQDPGSPNHQEQHSVPDTSSNNRQNKNTNPVISRQDYHLTQPCVERQATNKNSAQISPYTKLTQTTGPTLGGQKPKGRTNSTFFKVRIQLSLKPGKRRPQTQ